MNGLESAVAQIADALERRRIPYMIIGGVAVFVWARSRLTRDVDVTVIVPPERQAEAVRDLLREFETQATDAEAFVAQTRVLPIQSKDGVPIDVVFGMLPYEQTAVGRAHRAEIGGRLVSVCAPEDLIAHKIISDRPQDWSDVQAIVEAVADRLDRDYLQTIVSGLADILERPDLLNRLRQAEQPG